jgi:hypothetical protein
LLFFFFFFLCFGFAGVCYV